MATKAEIQANAERKRLYVVGRQREADALNAQVSARMRALESVLTDAMRQPVGAGAPAVPASVAARPGDAQ